VAALWADSEIKGKLQIGCISAGFAGYLYLNHHSPSNKNHHCSHPSKNQMADI